MEELKLFDALFHIELQVGQTGESYHYSFIKRDITESDMVFPMFVKGKITDLDTMTH